MTTFRGRYLRRLALWAMLSPFFLLSLLSQGVMPVPSDGGGLVMVICSGDGPVEVTIDPETGEPVRKSRRDASGVCAWAIAKPLVSLTTVADLPTLVSRMHPAEPPALPTIRVFAQATGLPPSTGPPFVL